MRQFVAVILFGTRARQGAASHALGLAPFPPRPTRPDSRPRARQFPSYYRWLNAAARVRRRLGPEGEGPSVQTHGDESTWRTTGSGEADQPAAAEARAGGAEEVRAEPGFCP